MPIPFDSADEQFDGELNNNLSVSGSATISGDLTCVGNLLLGAGNSLSGMVSSFTGERNVANASDFYKFGDNANNNRGICMPRDGKIIALSCTNYWPNSWTVVVTNDRVNTAASLTLGQNNPGFGNVSYGYVDNLNVFFSAGDRLQLKVDANLNQLTHSVATFWVKFD